MLEYTPSIRFPEFTGTWNQTRLGKIATFHKGKGITKADIKENGETKCIRYGELYTHYSEQVGKVKSATNLPAINLFLSHENDVLIPASGESAIDMATASCVKEKDIALGGDINVIRSDVDGSFLAYYLNNTKKNDVARYAQGISVIHLYAAQLKLLKLQLPQTENEAKKLGFFFSTLDKKISLLKEKHATVTQYKKGVMQKLFKQEIRFKDDHGNAFPNWQEKVMSQVLTPEIREIEKPTEKYLALGIRSHMKGTFQKPGSDPDAIAMDKLFVVRPNDLVVNITFAWEGAIAIAKTEDNGGLVSHRFPTYIFKKDQATHHYFKHIIQLKRFKYMLDVISPGGAGRNRVLSKSEFLKLKWDLPSVKEQEKIADFLDSLDSKLDAVNEQIELTQTFKKGLLQQMFI
jgi:type I restriction enzyme S subunit